MKNFFNSILPEKKTDVYAYYLILVAFLPFIYRLFGEKLTYMILNTSLLFVFVLISIFYITISIRKKTIKNIFKSPAVCLLFALFLWIFISAFFAYNKTAAWLGIYKSYHAEESVWQYMFYFSVAVAVILMRKENIKYILAIFMIVSSLIIMIQFKDLEFGYLFIHKNHTGYYLCMTVMIAVGMFFYSKSLVTRLLSLWVVVMHFISLILNGSMGPIIGLIAFFVLGLIYMLIHNRKMLLRLGAVFLCFATVVAVFDYIPVVKDLRDEEATTVEKVVGIGIIGLNKLGIITDEEVKDMSVAPGSDGYGRFGMWQRAYENMLEFPMFGLGAGSWKSFNEDMPNMKPHNDFLQIGVTGGFPALIFYVSLIGYLFVCFRKNHKKLSATAYLTFGALLVYLVQSVFGNIMPFTAQLYFLLIGIAIKEIDSKKLKEEDDKLIVESNVEQVEDNNIEITEEKKKTLKLEEN